MGDVVKASEIRILKALEEGDECFFRLDDPNVMSLLGRQMIGWYEDGNYEKVAILLPAGRVALSATPPLDRSM